VAKTMDAYLFVGLAITRVGQNRIYTPYMTVYLVISLPKIPYVNRIYMVLANPSHNHIYTVYIQYAEFLAGKSPNIQSYTVHTYSSGQPTYLRYIHTISREIPAYMRSHTAQRYVLANPTILRFHSNSHHPRTCIDCTAYSMKISSSSFSWRASATCNSSGRVAALC